jgi:hypothetical protein
MMRTSAPGTSRMLPRAHWQRRTTTPAAEVKIQKGYAGRMLAPLAGSWPHLRWARGPLSVPCRPGTPAYKLNAKAGRKVSDHVLPRVPRYWAKPPHSEGLRCRHASHGSGPRLPVSKGSKAATCPAAPDPTSSLARAPMPDVQLFVGMNKEVFGSNS